MEKINVLFVTDDVGGYQRSNEIQHAFHFGELIKVLQETNWLGFTLNIMRAHRSADPCPGTPQASHPIGADLYGFSFSATSLSGYDMCFFLSIARSKDPIFDDNTCRDEAAAIAAFMESGGGFFATGDHEDIGASINQYVPRVRSMRRWIYDKNDHNCVSSAPPATEVCRHDTLLDGSDSDTWNGSWYAYQFDDQSDEIPQCILLKDYFYYAGGRFRKALPHPLLCSPLGRINVLPDHMHEGWCEIPSDLSRDEDLPERVGKAEYPLAPDGMRVQPEVIAEAKVSAHETLNRVNGGSLVTVSPMARNKTFGVIAVYDGHLADIGRIVVDSTWHHFVNINLIGIDAKNSYPGMNPAKAKGFYSRPGDTPVPAYEKIMWYYRNLVYWLIPKQRQKHLWLEALSNGVRLNPRWEEYSDIPRNIESMYNYDLRAILGYAQLAEEYFSSVRGHCAQYHLLPILFEPIKRFDPKTWQLLTPEFDPWHPEAIDLAQNIVPVEAWRRSLLPDPDLLRHIALGTLVLAAAFHLRRYDTVDEERYAAVQALALDLLPRHLEAISAALDESISAIRETTGQIAALTTAATVSRKALIQEWLSPQPKS